MGILNDSFRVLRPKQWVKNLLVIAAPIASTRLSDYWVQVMVGILSFIGASSMGYLVNDWMDKKVDRLHEKKRFRPFASGNLNRKHYLFLLSVTFILTASGAAFLGRNFLIVLLVYLFITFAYTLIVKHIPILEMFWLASGFLVRAVAGSIIVDVKPTGWFNILVFFGALFVVSTKRLSEKIHSKQSGTRRVLDEYDAEVLSSVVTISAASTVLTFCLWVIQEQSDSYLAQLSILPFVSSIILYKSSSRSSIGEAPEDILLSNKIFFLTSSISCILLGVVFYQ